jgi:hypothetical protein
MGLNDAWDDDTRQRLVPYTKLMVNTRDDKDDQRALMAFDWLCRVHVPAWLNLAGFTKEADSLIDMGPFTDWSMLAEMTTRLQKAAERSRAARTAAWRDVTWTGANACLRGTSLGPSRTVPAGTPPAFTNEQTKHRLTPWPFISGKS